MRLGAQQPVTPRGATAVRAVDDVELLETPTRADRNTGKRALGEMDGHLRLVADALVEPCRRAPPPASTMPRSMMSAASSGGVLSSVDFIASMICVTGSSSARRISSDEMITVFGAR